MPWRRRERPRLAEIPGVSEGLARAIIAGRGLDMSLFPTAAHLMSWAGLCPSARQSGRVRSLGPFPADSLPVSSHTRLGRLVCGPPLIEGVERGRAGVPDRAGRHVPDEA